MEEVFSITEPKSEHSLRSEAIVDVCRSRWELENRNAVLETEISEQATVTHELRERIQKMDYQQRDLLKGLAKIVDDCDDILQVEGLRLDSADPDDSLVQQARKWYRKVERNRQNLMDRLNVYGVTTRTPAGMPSPELDTIHSMIETNAVLEGEIVKILRPGLLWNGTVLRCSLVVVAATETQSEETMVPLRPFVG
jgi:molecular chaperone GrpE (heat shock protein)